MIRHFLIGGGLGLGLWLFARGMFPPVPTLAEHLNRHLSMDLQSGSPDRFQSLRGRAALRLLQLVRGESLDEVEKDVAVTGTDLETHAVDKLNAGLGGAVIVLALGIMFGFLASPFAILLAGLGSFAAAYFLPDLELHRKATARRDEFGEAVNAFVGLVAVSISGGGGVNSAMADATSIGGGWCFETLRHSIDTATLHGESPWAGFDRLGRELGVVPLIELAGALSLAGNSGARVTETLQARAESGRSRELADAVSNAEKKSESMNIPVATMLLGWVMFMGYPAVLNLLGT